MVTIDAARTEWSSADVLTGVTRLAAEGRAVTADLIALLAVLDERRLFEAEGCGSLFEFCVTRLRLSESQAYHRIQAARAAARTGGGREATHGDSGRTMISTTNCRSCMPSPEYAQRASR